MTPALDEREREHARASVGVVDSPHAGLDGEGSLLLQQRTCRLREPHPGDALLTAVELDALAAERLPLARNSIVTMQPSGSLARQVTRSGTRSSGP